MSQIKDISDGVSEGIGATNKLLTGIRCCVCACSGATIQIQCGQTDAPKDLKTLRKASKKEHEPPEELQRTFE